MTPKHLTNIKSPQILVQAIKLLGTEEVTGAGNNPVILDWAKEIGKSKGIKEYAATYTNDEIPWCGLFTAICAARAGLEIPKNYLWALSWSSFGTPVDLPSLGDVLVFTRKGGGHVGLYVGEDDDAYHVLGGNQSNKVCVTRISKSRLYGARRTKWKYKQPANVKPVFLDKTGALSVNEA